MNHFILCDFWVSFLRWSLSCHRDRGCYHRNKNANNVLAAVTLHVLVNCYMAYLGPLEQKILNAGNSFDLFSSTSLSSCPISSLNPVFHPPPDMQMLPLEKSHSSPGSSKSSSDGQLRSHGPSRSQSKSSVTQAHLEDAGIAIAAAEAAVQQSRLQPSKSRPCPWYTSCDMPPFSCACKLCWDRLMRT